MKWPVLGFVLCLATFSEQSALKAVPESSWQSISDDVDFIVMALEGISEVECLAGSEWESKCYSCKCSDLGRAECVKSDVCDKTVDEKPYTCKPNTTFRRDCNTCGCLDNGLVLCTLKACSSTETVPMVKTELPPGKDCAPGTQWKSKCNECRCNAEGLPACTDIACPEHVNVSEPEMLCAPDTVWKYECNNCWCTAEGVPSCTRMGCHSTMVTDFNPDGGDDVKGNDIKVVIASRILEQNKTVVCSANRMFVKDCNTCWCNEDGTSYVCTRKVCVDAGDEEPEKLHVGKRKCKPNEVFELDCNSCRCNANGGSFSCTRRACPQDNDSKEQVDSKHSRKARATPQELPKNCLPRQEFRMDCNKCLCDNEGQNYSCTRIDCTSLSNNNGGPRTRREIASQMKATCTPGSVFEQGCNVCRCSADGAHATCTVKRCKVDRTHEEDTEAGSDTSFRCNPGEQFKRECNDCMCSADGKDVFCTLRLCDQDITTI